MFRRGGSGEGQAFAKGFKLLASSQAILFYWNPCAILDDVEGRPGS
jgi:hypothetical protein